jgi:hypothetical protein
MPPARAFSGPTTTAGDVRQRWKEKTMKTEIKQLHTVARLEESELLDIYERKDQWSHALIGAHALSAKTRFILLGMVYAALDSSIEPGVVQFQVLVGPSLADALGLHYGDVLGVIRQVEQLGIVLNPHDPEEQGLLTLNNKWLESVQANARFNCGRANGPLTAQN